MPAQYPMCIIQQLPGYLAWILDIGFWICLLFLLHYFCNHENFNGLFGQYLPQSFSRGNPAKIKARRAGLSWSLDSAGPITDIMWERNHIIYLKKWQN